MTGRIFSARFASILGILVSVCCSTAAHGQFSYQSDRFGYTGNVSVYNTLADAQNQVNARSGPHAGPQRDLSLYFNDILFDPNVAFQTAWFYTTQAGAPYSGLGNPNNVNHGLIQFNDQTSATSYSANGFWSTLNANVANASTFRLTASGSNALIANISRLWPAPSLSNVQALTAGTFIEWDLLAVAGGLTAVDAFDPGFYEAFNDPTSASGHMRGIFENTNVDPNIAGYYRYDLSMNMTNWAFANQGSLNGAYRGSYFYGAVPEPSSALLFSLALLPTAWMRRRRN